MLLNDSHNADVIIINGNLNKITQRKDLNQDSKMCQLLTAVLASISTEIRSQLSWRNLKRNQKLMKKFPNVQTEGDRFLQNFYTEKNLTHEYALSSSIQDKISLTILEAN